MKDLSLQEILYTLFFTLYSYEIRFFLPLLYSPIVLWFGVRAYRSRKISHLQGASNFEWYLYTILNLTVVLVWALIFGESYLEHTSPWFDIFDFGAPLGMFALLIVLPLGLISGWWVCRQREGGTKKKSGYIHSSRILYVLSVIPGLWLIQFYAGMMFKG